MLSIITINLNNAIGLQRTLESVSRQSGGNWELIIVDGGSSDAFLETCEKYKAIITTVISEPDRGISHAFNKGVHASKGEWVLFLNSGDCFAFDDSVSRIYSNMDNAFDVIQFRVSIVSDSGEILFIAPSDKSKNNRYLCLPHQGTVASRRFYEKAGDYSEAFKLGMDYELFIRKGQVKIKHCDSVITNMEAGGISQRNATSVNREWLGAQIVDMRDKSVFFLVGLFYFRCMKRSLGKLIRRKRKQYI